MKTSILSREPVKLGDKNTWRIRMLSTRDTKFELREKMKSRIKVEKHLCPILWPPWLIDDEYKIFPDDHSVLNFPMLLRKTMKGLNSMKIRKEDSNEL